MPYPPGLLVRLPLKNVYLCAVQIQQIDCDSRAITALGLATKHFDDNVANMRRLKPFHNVLTIPKFDDQCPPRN